MDKKDNNKEQLDNQYFSLDNALEFVGNNSRYQKRILQILSIHWFLFSLFIKGFPFFYQSPLFICRNEQGQEYVCDEYLMCEEQKKMKQEYVIYTDPHSIISSFQLYCIENSLQVAITISNVFLGGFIGLFIFSSFSTRLGRKKALLLSSILSGLSLIFASYEKRIHFLQLYFFLFGIGHGGYEKIMHQYVSEISGAKFKKYAVQSFLLIFSISQILFNALHYILKDWRIIIMFIAIPLLLVNLQISSNLYESPVFLNEKQRFQQCKYVLTQIAIYNQKQQFNYKLEDELKKQQVVNKYNQEDNVMDLEEMQLNFSKQNFTYFNLFSFKSLRKKTLCLTMLWLSLDIVSIGTVYSIQSLGNDINEVFLLLGVSELLAIFLNDSVIKSYQKKTALSALFFISFLSGILIYYIDIPYICFDMNVSCVQKSINVFLAMIVKFSFTLSLNILYYYTEEIYPSAILKKGKNYNFFMRKLGCLLMPFIVEYSRQDNINPMGIFGLISLLCLFVSHFFMDQTTGKINNLIEETIQKEDALIQY